MILMSNNQWYCEKNCPAWEAAGEDCSPAGRVGGLVRAYREIGPDILGLQEVSPGMAVRMMERLAEEARRDGDGAVYEYISGGDTPLVYRRDRFKLLESGFFRYEEQVPGLQGSFNNNETKSYAFGVFERRSDAARLAVMTTHLWYKSARPGADAYQPGSDVAREYQIRLASARMDTVLEAYGCPGFLVGDLNASVDSLCLRAAFAEGWSETHDLAPERDETCGYHPCGPKGWSRAEPGTFRTAIDHILVKNGAKVEIRRFGRLRHAWFDPISDHYPLYIDFTLAGE